HAVREAMEAEAPGLGDFVDVVPAATTVLVVVDEDIPIAPVRKALAALSVAENGEASLSEETIEIPVRYDGPDLTEVAQHTGLSIPEIVAAHTGTDWRVAFGGFAPGFAYLGWGDPRLAVPRAPRPPTSSPPPRGGVPPRFAYLGWGGPRLAVPRRREPRTSVAAGSVALAGEFSAIYPRSSPGGWQVIGHTHSVLF